MSRSITGSRRLGTAAALLGLVLTTLVGCGSNGGGQAPDPTPVPGATQGGKLTIGISFDQPGIGLKQGDTVSGFDADTATYVAKALGVPPENITWKEAKGDERQRLLTSGEADMIVSTFTITEERKQAVDFAGPYFVAHQDLLVRRNEEDITGPQTLTGKTLCSVPGTTSTDTIATRYGDTVQLKEFPRYSDCVTALAAGDVDAVTTDDVILAGFAAEPQYRGRLKVIGKGFSDERYGIGVKKGDTAMVQKVTAALQQYVSDGSWQRSLDTTVRPSGYSIPSPPTVGSPLTDARDVEDQDDGVRALLRSHAPFDGVSEDERAAMAAAATVRRYGPGQLVLDAFVAPSTEVFVVVEGSVDLWDDPQRLGDAPDERLGRGGVFGFSAMLTERSMGPRVLAAEPAVVAAIPATVVEPAFATRDGARFLVREGVARRQRSRLPSYSLVADLVDAEPLVVAETDSVAEVAARMTACSTSVAVVDLDRGEHGDRRRGLVTDALLRRRVLVEGVPGSAPAREVVDTGVPTVCDADSAAEALLLLLDRDAEHLLVTDRDGQLRGVLGPRHFAVSPASVGVSVHEQIRRAATTDELQRRARRVPGMLGDLLSGGLATTKVVAVYSAIIDTVVRRALTLVFADRPDLSLDAFTWLALGSNGRREVVLSSDIDSAAAFDDAVPAAIPRYREAFVEVDRVLAAAGLVSDQHGATARRAAFSRTNADWRAAAAKWLAAPEDDQGAMMTSLLVDGRPIHGDPGLPAVTRVFGELRRHPGTMRLLLQASLAARARARSLRDVFTRRDSVDLKHDALLPIVNIARWAALTVGAHTLSTPDRLHAAEGSVMLPAGQARNLAEIFEILQRLRLRYQLVAHERGERPSDVVTRERMSPIDRSVVGEAAREIAAAQRRMDKIAAYLPVEDWASPASP